MMACFRQPRPFGNPALPACSVCRGSGTTHRGGEEQEETFEEREANREAVTLRAEESGERMATG